MDVSIYPSQYTHYNCLAQYAAQGVKRFVVSVSQSVSLSCQRNRNRYLLTSSKHMSQLENSHVITYAYLAEAHSMHNS